MPTERWEEIDRVFDAALDLDASDRPAFLDKACAGDEELRREVDSLLAAHQRADKFIESPAMEHAARSAAARGDTFFALGRTIGPYRVTALLGMGGRG